jgi:DNA-binding MarR family transcriptional regulator
MLDVESATHLRGVVSRIARRLNASATSEGLNPTMLSRVIGALTSAELIVRTPDPADLRAWQVAATPEGARMHQRIKNARAQVVSESAARLPAEQVEVLIAALPALDALAEQLARPAGPQPARSAGR